MENRIVQRSRLRIKHLNNTIIREWSSKIKFRCRVFAKGPIYTENEQTIFRLLVGDETGFLHVVMIDISYHNTIQVSNLLDITVQGQMKYLIKQFKMLSGADGTRCFPGQWEVTIAENFNITPVHQAHTILFPKVYYSLPSFSSIKDRPLQCINVDGFVKDIPEENYIVIQTPQIDDEKESIVHIRICRYMGFHILKDLKGDGDFVRFTGLCILDDKQDSHGRTTSLECGFLGAVEVFPSRETMMKNFWRRNSPLQGKMIGKNVYGLNEKNIYGF